MIWEQKQSSQWYASQISDEDTVSRDERNKNEKVLVSTPEMRQLPVFTMWKNSKRPNELYTTPDDSHWCEALQVYNLPEDFHAKAETDHSQAVSQRRETFLVLLVWKDFHRKLQVKTTFEQASPRKSKRRGSG